MGREVGDSGIQSKPVAAFYAALLEFPPRREIINLLVGELVSGKRLVQASCLTIDLLQQREHLGISEILSLVVEGIVALADMAGSNVGDIRYRSWRGRLVREMRGHVDANCDDARLTMAFSQTRGLRQPLYQHFRSMACIHIESKVGTVDVVDLSDISVCFLLLVALAVHDTVFEVGSWLCLKEFPPANWTCVVVFEPDGNAC